jgi:hypothetical protein
MVVVVETKVLRRNDGRKEDEEGNKERGVSE